MSKDLTIFNDFFDDVPSLFNWNDSKIFKGFPDDFKKIMNGRSDFEETDDKYVLELEVPGVKKDEIDINVKYDNLTISWKRKRETKKGIKNKNYERTEGSFSRSFNVNGADTDKIQAELKNGVLKIIIPKKEGSKSKQIKINS